jgi:hypothetical protein
VDFDCRNLSLSFLSDGLALRVRKLGESLLKILLIEDRDGKRADAAMATALTAGHLF